jgi:hypothetical protein
VRAPWSGCTGEDHWYARGVPCNAPARLGDDAPGVLEEVTTTQDLLDAWREAIRAAELADRLAELASQAVAKAEADAIAAADLAAMAERAADAAQAAAIKARAEAKRLRAAADAAQVEQDRDIGLSDEARRRESAARDVYHEAEAEARARQDRERPQR